MSKESKILSEQVSASTATEATATEDVGLVLGQDSPALRGCVDFLEANTIFGTAWDPDDPSRVVYVDIYCAEKLLDRVAADMYREDLALIGIGDGHHGFEWVLPPEVEPEAVRIAFSESDVTLLDGPFFNTVAGPRSAPDPKVSEKLIELKTTLADLENKIGTVSPVIQNFSAKFDAFGERAKLLAARQDLGKMHDSLMGSIRSTDEKIDDITQSGTRIEGFLNIELGKRITKDLDLGGLNDQLNKIDKRLRRASYGRFFIVVLILGLMTAFALSQPIDWMAELRAALSGFFDGP